MFTTPINQAMQAQRAQIRRLVRLNHKVTRAIAGPDTAATAGPSRELLKRILIQKLHEQPRR